MAIDLHTVEEVQGSTFAFGDRLILGVQTGIANAAGGGAGSTVTTAVSFKNLPANYNVHVTPSQACWATITAKTTSGFNVVLTPISTVTLSAGTFDVTVVG